MSVTIGGETSEIILDKMKPSGKVTICGAVALYNQKNPIKKLMSTVAKWNLDNPRELQIKPFRVDDFIQIWDESVSQNLKWIEEGKLKYKETVTEGFENTMKALIGVMKGANFGKAIVKV